jgi:ABC-2 type transport system ATP-binding protein
MDEADRCDRVGIMYASRLIADDSPKALKAAFSGTLFAVEAEPLLQALDAARALPDVDDAVMFGTALHVTARADDAASVRDGLASKGIQVGQVRRIMPEMEDVFVQAVVRSERARAAGAAGGRVAPGESGAGA